MNIRPLPIILTVIVSAGLLVGGWFIYRNAVDLKPLSRIAAETPGVVSAEPEIGSSTVTLNLTLDRDANLRRIYDNISTQGERIIGSKSLKLNIAKSDASPKLDEVWATMLFQVAQAMDHRKYAEIPAAMKQAQLSFPGIQALSEIDDINVYITLKDDKSVKYIVLPRIANTMGVWPNA